MKNPFSAKRTVTLVVKENEEHSLLESLTYMVREELTGHKIQGSEDTISSWKKWIEERSSKTIENLSKSILDQREYAKIMRKLIGELELGNELGEDPDDEEGDGLDSDAEFTGSDEDQDIDQSDVQETDFSDAEMDDGTCIYERIHTDCFGNCLPGFTEDECGVCGGDGIDADNDSECDDVDDCVSTGAEYLVYDVDGNEVDPFLGGYDECGFCNGNGCHNQDCTTYPSSDYGCDGTILSLYNSIIPDMYSIHSIYPNPFNPATHIRYSLPEHTDVQIIVYNILGKQIEYLVNNFQSPGYHSIVWDASRYPSGIYFIRMVSNNFTDTRKILLIK